MIFNLRYVMAQKSDEVRKCTLVEVKASNGNIKSAKTILSNPEKYHVSQAIKLGDVNVETAPQTFILPLYMAFLLENRVTTLLE